MYQLDQLKSGLRKLATPEKAKSSAWFFKTGPGQYGEGDKFMGVTVPEQRRIAGKFKDLPQKELEKLIKSPWHEERLTGLFILVSQYQRGSETFKKKIYDFYMSHTKYINNWDLVDSSSGYIVGPYLENKNKAVLTVLARSKNLWERRIAMIATFYYIKQGDADEALKIAGILLRDNHDLIQKAVGWMLREIGKRIDGQILISFLNIYAETMPRTALRYAIERLSKDKREFYLNKKYRNNKPIISNRL